MLTIYKEDFSCICLPKWNHLMSVSWLSCVLPWTTGCNTSAITGGGTLAGPGQTLPPITAGWRCSLAEMRIGCRSRNLLLFSCALALAFLLCSLCRYPRVVALLSFFVLRLFVRTLFHATALCDLITK